MVFKAVGGVGKDVYYTYNSGHASSENEKEALDVTNKHKDHYMNKIIFNWKTFDASEVLCYE